MVAGSRGPPHHPNGQSVNDQLPATDYQLPTTKVLPSAPMRLIACVTAALTIGAVATLRPAQSPTGEQLFRDRCASCHTGAADSRAPAPDALRSRSPQAIIESLVN